MVDATIEVLARHSFATYEEWWRWEKARLQAGWSITEVKECDECEQLILREMGSNAS